MRIVIVSTASEKFEDFAQGNLLGTEAQLFGLAKALARNKHEVFIIRRWKTRSFVECIQGVYVINIETPYLYDACLKYVFTKMLFSKTLRNIVNALNPDIIQFTDAYTAYYLTDLKLPKVLVLHSPLYDWTNFSQSKLQNILWHIKRPLNLKIQTHVVKSSSAIVTLSMYHTKLAKLFAPNCTVKRIPNGINLSEFSDVKVEDENFVLYGGRLSKEKGVDVLIRAFSLVIKNISKPIKLLIVGSGPEETYLKQLTRSLEIENKVVFMPLLSRSKFIRILAKCSVFVLPSFYETFGVVILEAMSLGKPVIASNVAGPNEIITHWFNGFLFSPGNSYELADYIKMLIEDKNLRKHIGMNARNTASKYDFNLIVNRYLELYKLLIGTKYE
jgi:glycosyltransferase involved in cell wall biosynthesis